MTARPCILFVDDEPRILAGLRRMLRVHRDRWDMCFADGGEEALAAMQERPCDVIVSDYRMPGMDGAQLLERVRDRYPRTARVILSGQTDEANLPRIMALAHEFLTKPSTPEQLTAAIERLIGGGDRAGIQALPSPPAVLVELIHALQSDDASARSVGDVIEGDPAASAKVLQLVNSSGYAIGRRVSDVGQAVAMLGVHTVRGLVMMHDLIRTFDVSGDLPVTWMDALTMHSVETSRLCRMMAAGTDWENPAATAGLLHEVGQLVLASSRPREFARTLKVWRESATEEREDTSLCAAEAAILDACHTDIGADLLRYWGLPDPVVDAVLGHAATEQLAAAVDPRTAVALAHRVVEADLGPVCGMLGGAEVDEEALDERARAAVSRWRWERSRTPR
ncbi:HDOD domain-containing protein [Krasilnikovia sp. MM14-A1259]|uniref:HDOD domain-containing protein n=1 Tax=Krasilnikovia sp. MM14-A1259 TaxID=3373539 RepID=UPI00380B1AB5